MRGVTVLVFDLDDTLFPEREYVASGFRAVDRRLRERHALTGFVEAALGHFHAGRRGRIFDEALEGLGFAAHPALIQELVDCYRGHFPEIRLHPDSVRALASLRGAFRLAIITDGYFEVQKKKVAALGIGPQFEAIVYSDEFGRSSWKPSPEPYLRVMRTLGVTGPECLYVGDNPTKDFVTANALGWKTVQIVREDGEYARVSAETSHRAHHRIDCLDELDAILRGENRAVRPIAGLI
jgi:putative hydrolase of the HAD superfamily